MVLFSLTRSSFDPSVEIDFGRLLLAHIFTRNHFLLRHNFTLRDSLISGFEMESKEEKTDLYFAYISRKRDQFIQNLTRFGVKLVNLHAGSNYNLDHYLKTFVPSEEDLKRKIYHEVKESKVDLAASKDDAESQELVQDPGCFDFALVDALKAEFVKFEKDFQKLLKVTDPDDDVESSPPANTPKYPERAASAKSAVKKPEKLLDEAEMDKEADGNRYCIDQVLNPGELSKIFVQKHRVDAVRSKTDKPNFNDDLVETIYVYRSNNKS